jgi:F-type H+-transporting ATPase subunit c
MRRKVFAALAVIGIMMVLGSPAFAEDAAADQFKDYGLLAAGLGIALAAFGGAFGQGRTASAALEGIARNPNAADKMFVPMVLGLVLIESLVIYALVVEILILFS